MVFFRSTRRDQNSNSDPGVDNNYNLPLQGLSLNIFRHGKNFKLSEKKSKCARK